MCSATSHYGVVFNSAQGPSSGHGNLVNNSSNFTFTKMCTVQLSREKCEGIKTMHMTALHCETKLLF
jgi:hypothetical protein